MNYRGTYPDGVKPYFEAAYPRHVALMGIALEVALSNAEDDVRRELERGVR
jgi:hypothetical protein